MPIFKQGHQMKFMISIKSKLIDWALLFKPKPVEPSQPGTDARQGLSQQQQFLREIRSLFT
jgi:hypothetical protein